MKADRSKTVQYAAVAVCLWLAAIDPALAQESIIAPIGEQFNSWTDTFQGDFFPFLVTLGILIAIGLGSVVSIKIGAFAFAGVVAAAVAWGTRTGVIGLGA